MGQASLKQLWSGLLFCSTSVDMIILLRTAEFIRLNVDWSLLHVQPHVSFALPFPLSCSDLPAEQMQVISLDHIPSLRKTTANGRARHFAEEPILPSIPEPACLNDACNN